MAPCLDCGIYPFTVLFYAVLHAGAAYIPGGKRDTATPGFQPAPAAGQAT